MIKQVKNDLFVSKPSYKTSYGKFEYFSFLSKDLKEQFDLEVIKAYKRKLEKNLHKNIEN